MFKKVKTLISGLALVMGASATLSATSAVAEQAPEYNPAMWKVEHKGKVSYLFGSIHLGDDSMYPLPKKVMDAYKATEALAVEANVNDINQFSMAMMVQEMAMDLKNPITDSLSEKTKEAYTEYCKDPILPCQQVNMFEPWFASLTIQGLMAKEAGFDEESGIDLHFLKDADSNDKEIIELEGLEYQLKLLDGMSERSQDLMFLSSITMEMGSTEKLMAAWRTGDLEGFIAAEEALQLGELSEQEQADLEVLNEEFNADRNVKMADKIDTLLQEGKTLFVVVGALHYTGEEGIHSLLKAKGYKVTRL